MRVCLWHGWVLEGSGSAVSAARQAQAMRAAGHDVLLVCQERHPERFEFIDTAGRVDRSRVFDHAPGGATSKAAGRGRVILLRPEIGTLLPVFVLDEYEGFDRVVRFVDLGDEELESYLEANAAALRTAVSWHGSDVVIAGHIVPGPVVARRALGPGAYSVKVHGSDLEYAVEKQERYADLAREALEGAVAVLGLSDDVLRRTLAVAPAVADRIRRVPPGVDVDRFRPMPRRDALYEGATRLAGEPSAERGRPHQNAERIREAVAARDAAAIDRLGTVYDQMVPDPQAAGRLRRLAEYHGPIVGSFGKLIVPKGVERLIEATGLLPSDTRALVVGFGGAREWYEALVAAIDAGDVDAVAWIARASGMAQELGPEEIAAARGLGRRVDFTGMLDHRYAPFALAALDVLVVPSTLKEALAMVAAEGASAGALPLVARHSGLAEAAATLEAVVDMPGAFSFEPGPGATDRLAAGLERLLALPPERRTELRGALSAFVANEWTWDRQARAMVEAASGQGAAPLADRGRS